MDKINKIDSLSYYTFAAIRGVQSGKEFFITTCPLRLIPKIFLFDEEEIPIPPEHRAQRTLNKSRIPSITKYIVNNPTTYVFSSLTASIDAPIQFESFIDSDGGKLGYLKIPLDSTIIINDGQHRRAAIDEAIKINPDLQHEHISIVFFQEIGLARCQQMFSDLNQHAVKPTRSLSILYDQRDELGNMTKRILNKVPIFKDYTENEKTTISNRSIKVFTLNAIFQANKILLNTVHTSDKINKNDEKFIVDFWNQMFKYIKEWQMLVNKEVSSYECRQNFVNVHGVILNSLATIGKSIRSIYGDEWFKHIDGLKNINWSRTSNSDWQGRVLTSSGRISKTTESIILTSNYIKKFLNLPLDDKELETETKFQNFKFNPS